MFVRKITASKALVLTCCILAAAMLLSCGTMSKGEKKKESLLQTAEAFNTAFKWEDYHAAALFLGPGKKERFWKEVDLFKGKIRITDFQVRDIDYLENSSTGTIILWVQYFRTNSPTLQTVTLSQKWYFSETEKHWLIGESGFQALTK